MPVEAAADGGAASVAEEHALFRGSMLTRRVSLEDGVLQMGEPVSLSYKKRYS